jgi:hypothetical protein
MKETEAQAGEMLERAPTKDELTGSEQEHGGYCSLHLQAVRL